MKKFSNAAHMIFAALMISLTVIGCSKDSGGDDNDVENTAPPAITSITPSSVKIGGTITINGTNLLNPVVEVATKVATVKGSTLTSATAIVPANIALGDASVRVTTNKGTVVSSIVIIP